MSHCVFHAATFGLQAVCFPRKRVISDSSEHMTCHNLPYACVNCKCVIRSTALEMACCSCRFLRLQQSDVPMCLTRSYFQNELRKQCFSNGLIM